MLCGAAEFNGLEPSSQFVSANRATGSRRAKETIVTHARSFLKFINISQDTSIRPKSLKRVVKPGHQSGAVTGPESRKNLDCPVLQEARCAVSHSFLLYSLPAILFSFPPTP